MGTARTVGIVCRDQSGEALADGTLCLRASPRPGVTGISTGESTFWDEWQRLSPEKRECLMDIGQLTLDVVGIVEPTPFADITSGSISLYRGDWFGALISGISIVPYVGDIAKVGRLPRYLSVVEKAVSWARVDLSFNRALLPVFTRLADALEKIPTGRLPKAAREAVDRIREKVGSFLSGSGKAGARLEKLTDQMLVKVFGSTKNIGTLQRKSMRTVVEFLEKHGVAQGHDLAEWKKIARGIDFHAVDAVRTKRLSAGDRVAEYVEVARSSDRHIGQWMVKLQGGVSHRGLGLSGAGRKRWVFRVKKNMLDGVEVLVSKAAPIVDDWTLGAAKTGFEKGGRLRVVGEHAAGGGEQYFLPRAWEYLEEVR